MREAGAAAVIGMGLMGRSIVACLMAAGHRVTAVTDDMTGSAGATAKIAALLEEMQTKGLLQEEAAEVMLRFRITGNLKDIAGSQVVFESVTENLLRFLQQFALQLEILRYRFEDDL